MREAKLCRWHPGLISDPHVRLWPAQILMHASVCLKIAYRGCQGWTHHATFLERGSSLSLTHTHTHTHNNASSCNTDPKLFSLAWSSRDKSLFSGKLCVTQKTWLIHLFLLLNVYAFSRRYILYPSDLLCHIFCQYVCSLGIEPTTFCAANAMLYHWVTGTPKYSCKQQLSGQEDNRGTMRS